MKHQFTDWEPMTPAGRELLAAVVSIIAAYEAQGYQLTLRQLYYQLVSRNLVSNQLREYKRLGELVKNARYGGHIDWDSIVDLGRSPVIPPDWPDGAAILESAANQFRLDRWRGQERYLEVWCEKQAMASIIEPITREYHVRFLADKGYNSATAMYDAGQRMAKAAITEGLQPTVIYMGDHDPSGMDMSRDIEDRLYTLSTSTEIDVLRLALTFDQVEEHQPPPNPTKLSDSRAESYIARYGDDSWELDALEPATLDGLIRQTIESYLDLDQYNLMVEAEEAIRESIRALAPMLVQEEGDEGA